MAQITLGNFSVQNGRNVLFGLGGSGLDTASLILALTQTKSAPAALLQQKISKNAQVASALGRFQQMLSQLQTATNALRNPPGVSNAADNAFAYNSASISANKSVSGSSYVSVTAAPGTALQSYTITEISSLAAIQKQSTGTFAIATADTAGLVVASGAASGQFKAGTFTIDSVNGPAVNITLDETDTLNSIAQKFNNAQTATGISASVVKISDGNFKLVFSSLYSGTAYAVDLNDTATTVSDPDGVLTQIINGSGEFADIETTQAASNAVFKLDGNTITRSTNSIGDLVTGITFNLLQKTPSGEDPGDETEITVSISPDTSIARSGIISFINAYNALRQFAVEQTQLNSDGTYADASVLANNSLFRTTMNTLAARISSAVAGIAGGNPKNLADLGITFTTAPATATSPEVPNVLTVDEGVLQSALQADFANVRKVFEFSLTSDNTNLRVFSRTNALAVNNFTLSVNPFATQTSNAITPRASQTTGTITPLKASQTTSTITVADADTAIVFDSPDGTQMQSGTITLNGQDIALAEGDSLNDVVDKFNLVSGSSGVTARLEEVAAGQFRLVFTSTEADLENVDLTDIGVDPDGVFGNFTFTTQTGADAPIVFDSPGAGEVQSGTITVNGEVITLEEGDSLNDIVTKFNAVAVDSGVKAHLVQVAAGQYQLAFTSEAGTDVGAADTNGLFDEFAFGAVATGADAAIAFSSPDSGGFGVGTVTVNGQTIEVEAGDSLNDIVAKFTAVAGDSDLSVNLQDLGDGSYKLVFTGAASSTPVNYNLKSSGVDPDGVFSNLSFTAESTFQATYDPGTGNITLNLTGEAISNGAAYRISGASGTVFEGLVLIYGAGLTGSITVTATQGIGDKVYNDGTDLLKFNGSLAREMDTIAGRNTQLNKDIEKINDQVARYRDQLLRQFGALEAALSRVNLLLAGLDAQAQARRNASS